GLKIGDRHDRVCRRFDKDHLGVRFEILLEAGGIRCVRKVKLHTVIRKNTAEKSICAAVGIVAEDHMVAILYELEHRIDGGHARREGESELGVLESCYVFFEG